MDVLITIIVVLFAAMALALGWALYRLRRYMRTMESRLAALTARVYSLETAPEMEAAPDPAVIAVMPAASPAMRASPAAEPVADIPPLAAGGPPPVASIPEDWEAVVGGNWLNRIGALVLVIGIALFLGYSLTHLGPAGKVAIGFAAGVSMLLAGIASERHEKYASFALSLVAGGWAIIYFTAYAAHALEPARIISSPMMGALLLFAISGAMIAHALTYQSETGTALAFAFAFISLNVSPLTDFSVVAALLLAVAMLILAYRLEWFRLAVAGVILAYTTFFLREDFPSRLFPFALWIQWLAFEGFDIVDLRRRGLHRGLQSSLFLLNAAGLFGVLLLHQSGGAGWTLFSSAGAYLASTLLRATIPFEPAPGTRARVLGGAYEGALTASALLLVCALLERFSGARLSVALLVQGQLIVAAGLVLKNRYVRQLGGAVFFLVFFKIVVLDVIVNSRSARDWTPVATAAAVVFLANRIHGGWRYSTGGGILLALVAEAELPEEWFPLALGVLGLAGVAVHRLRPMEEVRWQQPLWAVAAFIAGVVANGYGSKANVPVALTVVCLYAGEFLVRNRVHVLYSLLGTTLLTLLLFREVQGRLLTVALGIEGAALLLSGMFASERVLRLSGLAIFLLCIGKAFVYDLQQLDTFSRILSFIVLGLLLLGASWVYTRFRERIKRLL